MVPRGWSAGIGRPGTGRAGERPLPRRGVVSWLPLGMTTNPLPAWPGKGQVAVKKATGCHPAGAGSKKHRSRDILEAASIFCMAKGTGMPVLANGRQENPCGSRAGLPHWVGPLGDERCSGIPRPARCVPHARAGRFLTTRIVLNQRAGPYPRGSAHAQVEPELRYFSTPGGRLGPGDPPAAARAG